MNNNELFCLIKHNQKVAEYFRAELRSRNISIRALLENGFRVEAVIQHRDKTGCSLKEANDFVNELIKNKL
jgi:sRNA-binding regulator protein Hfq